MPSVILSDNGVSSGTSGIKTTGSNDGALALQTTTAGGTATTALTIDTGQRTKFPTTIAVGDATPSTSGSGITFPATQSASSDANTLDDYEEGNWTPTAAGSSGSLTSYTSNGTYTKIGDLVFVRGRILLTNVGTAGGALNAGGLPFTTSNGVRPFVGVCREDEFTGNGYLTWATTSGTTFTINTFTNGAITWTNNYAYVFSATYKAA